jgi:hypothetical protein
MDEAQHQPQPPLDFNAVFWNPSTSKPMTLYDVDPVNTFAAPTKRADALRQCCQDRLDIYDQLERALRDERRRSLSHRHGCSPVVSACVPSCCFCCSCYGYSPGLQACRAVLAGLWAVVHKYVWQWFWVKVFTPTRALYAVVQSCFRLVGMDGMAGRM